MAKKGYYWIKPVDMTLNGMKYYQAQVVGNIEFHRSEGRIVFRLTRYFPVGSIFHFMHTKENYVITKRLKVPGLVYEAKREDDGPLLPGDYSRFTSGRNVYRTGFLHENGYI